MNNVSDSILSKMSLREKIAQLYIISFNSTNSQKIKIEQERLVQKEKIGGLITMKDKVRPAVERLNRLNRLSSTPLLISIDGEWGASMRYSELQQFPRQMQMGAMQNDSLAYQAGYAIGKECRELNIHVNYAPSVDINNNPNNPVINTRSYGENRDKVADYALSFLKGMRAAGVAGSAKHFPGHGDTDVDSHKGLPELNFSKERLDSLELIPFKKMIENGVDMVMVAHLSIPIIDRGRPASISHKVVTELLRNELGFDGIIITDALNMDAVAKYSGIAKNRIPLEAYKAGVDIILMPEDVESSIGIIEEEFKAGKLDVADLDKRVKRVLNLKFKLGLFEKDYNPIVSTYGLPEKLINLDNATVINDISRNSMLLVKNMDSILPIKNLNDKNIGYLGLRGNINGKEFASTLLNYTNLDTFIIPTPVKLSQLERAKAKFKDKDLVIVAYHVTDARPHKNFDIDDQQMEFITSWAKDMPIVVVYHGSPYAIEKINNIDNFKAFLIAHSNTPANNFISAQTLFGGAKAVGVMPVSAAWLNAGESLLLDKQVRLGYDFLPNNKVMKSDFRVENGIVKGNTRFGDTTIVLSETAYVFTILPFIADMVCSGKLAMNSYLMDYMDISNNQHKNLRIDDIVSHRSGLPKLSDDFVYTQESIQNLQINFHPFPEFSDANLYYLYALAGFSYPEADKEIIEGARNLFYKNEMFDSSISEDGEVKTTLKDLSKFIFMLHNGGEYGGNRVMKPCEARFINDILLYYSHNNSLTIFENRDNGNILFRKGSL